MNYAKTRRGNSNIKHSLNTWTIDETILRAFKDCYYWIYQILVCPSSREVLSLKCFCYRSLMNPYSLFSEALRIISRGVCVLLSLLSLLDIWSRSRLWILKASVSWVVHSWRYWLLFFFLSYTRF